MISPTAVRIDASSICQLECPICPTFTGENEAVVGRGTLKFGDFKRLVDDNPQIRFVELGNWGEAFLNNDLPKILGYAYEKNVIISIDEGSNLNNASNEALEALVKYQTARVRCAVDGLTQDTYQIYRAGGNLKQVISNIQKINTFKQVYHSEKPELIFQFIIFGHNENQIEAAKIMAKILNMKFEPKLNWSPEFMAVQDRDIVRQVTGFADRTEFLDREEMHYSRHQCYDMWHRPQVNWDGKLLGCARNFWGYYEENVFETGFLNSINNKIIQHVREFLMGNQTQFGDFPCKQCGLYKSMRAKDNWITEQELAEARERYFWHIST